ncbi:MAG: sodium/proline symporter PutP [Christensenellaceae bacterium]|nr:sodium/proline symporter PutP [Christensenellaceae bacterium]
MPDQASVQVLISMVAYLAAIIVIGVFFMRRANENSENYFIGGRTLGPWIAAMSAEASDMSGWLLMGLPGVAYWCGLADAAWTAIGLAIGTYINWLLVAKRLRRYSIKADNAITIPDFFSKRFKEQEKKPLLLISAAMILIFFAVYTGSCFVTGGKLFSQLFGLDYKLMMIAGAAVVLFYTLLGGFLAESFSDFIQGVIMILALLAVLGCGVAAAGGFGAMFQNLQGFPGFLSFFGIATPNVDASGLQTATGGLPDFGPAAPYGILTILSTMSWGLGYFGMPQVLLRFVAIRKTSELTRARRIATTWCVIALFAAVFIGLTGRVVFPHTPALASPAGAESVFILLSQLLFHPLIAGIIMAGILAAVMSSSDSYLLIASSAIAKDIFQRAFKRDASEKQVMLVSRATLLLVSLVGILIALDENSVIFSIVSFAWAGFGAAFGPLVFFSLFWKRTTHAGAIAGLLTGGGMVFLWKLVLKPMGGVWGIYELLPAFLLACLAIVLVSLLGKAPSKAIQEEFEAVKASRD